MCGGIAAGLEQVKQSTTSGQNTTALRFISRKKLVFEQFLTHLGRISTYVLLGVLAGTLGFPLWQQGWLPVQRVLFALAALIFLFQGYLVLTKNKTKTTAWEVWLNTKTAALWSKLSKLLHQPGRKPHFLVGLVWGLVPCGLIYSILPLAFLSGDGVSGGLLMLAFGLGTLPNLLLISGFSARLAAWGHQTWARYMAAGLMIFTGLFGLYRALTLPDALLRGGFCIG
jgi:sulfite exporter TauE/SafE